MIDFLTGANIGLNVLDFLNQNDTSSDNLAAVQEALAAAQEEINQGADIAIDLIEAGEGQAAAAIFHGAEQAAGHVLEWYGISEGLQREFFNIAMQKLEPFVNLGISAFDEMASMLGIKNSQGELVPYDIRKLEQTPGYQFQFDQGQKAVETSQVGRHLSGRAAKELTVYGQGLASQYFNNRIAQLSNLGQFGANAAANQASIATNTGANLGRTAFSTGTNLGNIEQQKAGNLANIYTNSANNQAQVETNRSNNLVDVTLAGVEAETNANQQEANNFSNLLQGTMPLFNAGSPVVNRVSTTGYNLLDRANRYANDRPRGRLR